MNIKINKKIITTVLFMLLILILSTIPMNKCLIKQRFGALVALKSDMQRFLHIKLDFDLIQNLLHFPFFLLLAFLWMGIFAERKVVFKKAAAYTLLITLVFSALDEFFQVFASTRDASIADLLLNLFGCIVGIIVYKMGVPVENRVNYKV